MTSPSGPAPARPARRGLIAHAVAAAVALLAISAFVGLDGYFFIDEAAIHAQLDSLEDGTWVVRDDLAGSSDVLELPMARAHPVDGGYAPFAKHPVHVQAAHLLDELAGRGGVRALSALGVLVAGVGAALAAAPLGRRAALLALWVTVVASPLVFQAQLVVGHGLAAGISALLLWRFSVGRATAPWLVASAGLGAAGVLVRSEMALLLAAVVVVGVVDAGKSRRSSRLVVAVAAAAGGLTAYVREPILVERWVGGEAAAPVVSSSSRGGLDGFLAGLRTALLQPDYERPGAVSALTTVLVVLLGVTALVLLRRRTTDLPLLAIVAAGTVAAAVVHLTQPDIVPGIVWAFPALWMLVGLTAIDLRRDQVALPLAVAGVFAVAVLVTQYEVAGGGLEWGWRYAAVAVPWVAPAVALGVVRLRDAAGEQPVRLAAFAAVLGAFLLIPASGITEQRRYLADTQYFLVQANELADEVDAIVSLDPSFGRLAYPATLDGRVVGASLAELDEALAALARAGRDEVAVLWRGDRPDGLDVEALEGADERYVAAGFRAVLVRPNVRSPV